MRVWQLQEAKAKFSELVKLSQIEPQVVSVRGKEEAVLLSVKKYKSLVDKKPHLLKFLQSSPLSDIDILFERDKSQSRNIKL